MSEEPAEPARTSDVGTAGPPPPAGYGAQVGRTVQGTPSPAVRTPPPAGPPPPPAGPVYGPIPRYGHPPSELHGKPATLHAWAQAAPPAPPPFAGPDLGYASWTPSPPQSGLLQPGTWGPTSGPAPPWSAPRRDDYASWVRRVAGAVIDALPAWIALAVLVAGYLPTYVGFFRGDLTVPPRWALVVGGSLLSLGAFGWAVYNRYFLAGRTGQSIGKRVMKTWLVSQTTGRPINPFNAFLRDLLHILDGIGYVGYLWPLWDDERQTLADKLAQTVVVRTPVAPLTELERRRS